MKKLALYIALTTMFFTFSGFSFCFASSFPQAIKTCENYSKQGSITYNGEYFDILVTLEKAKDNKCVYKEKIYQDKDYQLLTCNFEQKQLGFLSDSMQRFNDTFKSQIAKNNIFEAKMTTNGEIFQRYLINPSYCKITHSKKK